MRKYLKLNYGAGLIIALCATSVVSCKIDMPKETESSFETMTVKKTDIEIPIKFSAKMKGQSDVTISPQVSGQLMKICVTEGQQVSAGQTLFVIDSRNAKHELQSAQASVQSAQANVQSAQAGLQSAQANLQSAQAKASVEQARATVEQARASVTQAQTGVSSARVNLGLCTITSPVSGIVGTINVRAGDQVSPMT